jgi:crotonobetainyl-CoA:carnitine CoA-transferase CaiB-like acyl-CoA transferase
LDILHLIDRLEEMLADARRVPVGGGVIVSRQKLADLIDRMRVAVPREVYDSREVVEQRDELLRQAQEEATALLAQARDELEKRLAETEVVKAADERAHEIIAEAEGRARDLGREAEGQARERLDEAQAVARTEMREADAYALQTLRKLETELEGFLSSVRKGVDALEIRSAERPKD